MVRNGVCMYMSILFQNILLLDSHMPLFLGFFEQVSWSACPKGESKKSRSGHLNYKVLIHAHLVVYLIMLEILSLLLLSAYLDPTRQQNGCPCAESLSTSLMFLLFFPFGILGRPVEPFK